MSDSQAGPLDLDLKDDGAFPEINETAWRALVEAGLKGADFERRLVKKTPDGIDVRPLYGPADGQASSGLPGQAPYTRGAQAATSLTRPWDVVLRVDEPDLKAANAIILEGLESGVSHLDLIIADHTQGGLTIKDRGDMEALLAGVDLALISVSLTGGEEAGMVSQYIAMIGGPKVVRGSIGLDPLGALATRGGLTKSIEEALAFAGSVAVPTAAMTKTFRTMNVDLRGYDAAGASPALSLAIAMATGTAYLRALETAGLSIDEAAGQISFVLTTDTDLFVSIAKLRAARTLWSRIVTASGGSPEAAAMMMTVETASTIMTGRDPHTNILRTAIAGFGAAVAGANAISILPYTHALGLPNALARRIARNIHVLLAEESNLGRVIDPAGGSYALEHLSGDVAGAAWAQFQAIEKQGGMAQALTSGRLQEQLTSLRAAALQQVATRKISITGVSEFADLAEKAADVVTRKELASPASDYAVSIEPLVQGRLSEPFEVLRDAADNARQRPSVFLANIGPLASFTARAAFAKNLFEAGGFSVEQGDGGTDAAAITAAFKQSGAQVACLCSSDPLYKDHAEDVGKALGAAGAKLAFLAGAPGDLREPLIAAGVTDFIHVGANVLEALTRAQSAAGVSS